MRCRRPTPSHPELYALLSTRQRADSLSAANKLLIRCAWADTKAFASAGYDPLAWAPGSCKCPSPPPYKFTRKELEKAVQAFDANPASAEETYGSIASWDVSGVTDMSSLFYYLENFNADISNWDTSGVTDMRGMFDVRSAARTLPDSLQSRGASACAPRLH